MQETQVLPTGETPLVPQTFPPDQNPARVYIAGLASGSQRTMRSALEAIATLLTQQSGNWDTLPWGQLRFQHTAAIRARLRENRSAATVNKMLSALRGTLRTAWRLGQMPAEEYQRACGIERVSGETVPSGRSLSTGEIVALLRVCRDDPTPAGVRDAALIALLYAGGLRRAEAVALQFTDFRQNEENAYIRVQGKRNKERLVPVAGGTLALLKEWRTRRGDDKGALFLRIRKGNTLTPDSLTTQAVYFILAKRGKEAGLATFSPHDLRRTFVGDLLDRGADIVTVQKLAGHANVTTTARYDRRGEVAKQRAVELLHIPYEPRQEYEQQTP